MLSIGRPGIIDETPLSYEREQAGADRTQSLCGARRRAPAAALRRAGELLERDPEVRLEAYGKPLRGPGSPIRRGSPLPAPRPPRLAHGRHDPT